MTTRPIQITDDIAFGGENPPLFIAGPCVIESREHALAMARTLRSLRDELGINLVFKSSFDKANRTSIESFRGPGLEEGLEILRAVKEETGLPLLSDIHEWQQAEAAAKVLDVLQIPAFLCRQTDLVAAAARTGKAVAVKKGQFLSPEETKNILEKGREAGNEKVFITERGSSFGYQNLEVAMRAFPIVGGVAVYLLLGLFGRFVLVEWLARRVGVPLFLAVVEIAALIGTGFAARGLFMWDGFSTRRKGDGGSTRRGGDGLRTRPTWKPE